MSDFVFPNVPEFSCRGGLTKREFFAAMAMQAVVGDDCTRPKEVVPLAIFYADALIAALAKETP